MAADPTDIRNFQRLNSTITTSGRLRDEDLAHLATIGVGHVINLALDDHPEALADEGERLAGWGIGYTHIPVPFRAPDDEHYAAFVSALEAAVAPVHAHCIMNYRVSPFFYRYHRERLGMPESEARRLLEQQWAPDKSDAPECRPWADFLARTGL